MATGVPTQAPGSGLFRQCPGRGRMAPPTVGRTGLPMGEQPGWKTGWIFCNASPWGKRESKWGWFFCDASSGMSKRVIKGLPRPTLGLLRSGSTMFPLILQQTARS